MAKPYLMASNLQKYKYVGRSSTRPKTSSTTSLDKSNPAPHVPGLSLSMDTATIKADILSSLRKDILSIIREELDYIRKHIFPAGEMED